MKNLITKHKWLSVIGLISFICLIYVISQSQSPKSQKNSQLQNEPTTPEGIESLQKLPKIVDGKIDETDPLYTTAKQAKSKLEKYLPIYLKDIKTSSGMTVTASAFTLPNDPEFSIHIEIYGIDYLDKTPDENNLNLQAYQEAFIRLKSAIEKNGVQLKDIYLILESDAISESTAQTWVKKYNLLD